MKTRLSILLLLFVFGLTSCFDDETSPGTQEVGAIEIGKLRDTAMISYNQNVLRVLPDVKAGYPESEMKYAWYIYGGSFEDKKNYRENRIDENGEKELAYEVNLPSGVYTVVFEATAPNDYVQTATFRLSVSTPFSQGFYILKENADGNTELDLLTADGLVSDLMNSMLGASLSGKPLGVSVIYNNGYIDEEDAEMKSDNMVHVFAERDYRAFRTEDMYQTFSRDNLMFEPVSPDETFCAAMMDMNGIIFLSDKGFYRSSAGISSGKLGVPEIEGGSKFIQSLEAGAAATVFWNGKTHTLWDMTMGDLAEEDLGTGQKPYELPAGINAADLECLASGLNYSVAGDVAWFLCEERSSGKRLFFHIEAVELGFWQYDLNIKVHVVSADKHLAKGSVVAGNGLSASVLYVVDNNELYLCDLDMKTETPFSLQGLEGEITYISNNYLNLYDYSGERQDGSFDYLVVASRTGEGYRLYLYDKLVGGIPTGKAKEIVGGTGTVKGVCYLSTTLTSDAWSVWTYYGPLYPYGN